MTSDQYAYITKLTQLRQEIEEGGLRTKEESINLIFDTLEFSGDSSYSGKVADNSFNERNDYIKQLETENKELKDSLDEACKIGKYNLTLAQVLYLVHKSPVCNDQTAKDWALLLHVLTGFSYNTLRANFNTNSNGVYDTKDKNKLDDKTEAVDSLYEELKKKYQK